MRYRGDRGILILTLFFLLMFVGVVFNYYKISEKQPYIKTTADRPYITINAGNSQGTIYDRKMRPLVNASHEVIGIIVPDESILAETMKLALDRDEFAEAFELGRPFAFRCREKGIENGSATYFEMPVRYSYGQTAQHIIGYLSEGRGASGIEFGYEKILRGGRTENSVSYYTDGQGNVLIGEGKSVIRSDKEKNGVVTTLDKDIQKICESFSESISCGAVIVSDVSNGNILGLASYPQYSWDDIETALSDERSPLINRALYSYSVGSVFKLVTACEAMSENLGGFVYECNGKIDISGQLFNCHRYDGHGVQDMKKAVANSCNTYFISLSRCLDIPLLRSRAYDMGFGKEIPLCYGITASAGHLPAVEELLIPAELANFSFGQGKLTSSPLQINRMTAAIANGGKLYMSGLIKGITTDGETVSNEKKKQFTRVMGELQANELRNMMISAVYDTAGSNAKPELVKVGAKTSTAQTGRMDENGEELCHAWITGFFPAEKPQYAVTVLVEDGGYGNDAAAPVFRDIADKMMCKNNLSDK